MNSRLKAHLFLLVVGLFYLAQYIYAPFLTAYVRVLGGSMVMTGLVAGAYGLLQGLVRLPLGFWSDRLAWRKPFILTGTIVAGLSALGMGLATRPEHLLLFRSAAGLAAGTWVLFTVYYAGLFPPEQAGRSMGLLTFAASAGQLAGNLLGGFLAEHWGWTAPFLAGLVPGVLGFLLAAVAVKDVPSLSEKRPQTLSGDKVLQSILRWRVIDATLLAVLTHFIFYATVLGFTPVYAKELGLSRLSLGLLGTVGGAAYVSGTLLATGGNSHPRAGRWMLTGSFAVVGLATWLTPYAKSFGGLAAIFFFVGLCRGTTYPVFLATVMREADPECEATTMGFFQAIYALGMFGGPAVAGAVAQRFGLEAVFLFCAALALAGLVRCAVTLADRKAWEGKRALQS
ncbi:MAG: MFS transporter [Chitinophagales bacterium]